MKHLKSLQSALFFILLLSSMTTYTTDDGLPYSYGPGPLFSFGQNVQKKNGFVYRQIYMFIERDLQSIMELHNHGYYGFTNWLTLVIKQPIVLKRNTIKNNTIINNRGLGSTRIELEMIPYMYEVAEEFRFRITSLIGIILPDSTTKLENFISLKSTSFFLGYTQSSTTPRIFQYSGLGIAIPTTKKHNSNFNYRVFYEMGFSHAIYNANDIYFGIDFEVSGEYQKSHRVHGKTDFTTGGNSIYYGPSFRFSMKHCIIQTGMQYPWVKHRKVVSTNPTNYRFAFAAAMRF
jgi:hypothetical protein